MNQTQALVDAVRAGDLATADSILESHPEAARGAGDGGESPLLEALYRGQAGIVGRIAGLRETSLVEAAALGDETRVRELASRNKGALGERSSDGWTALHLAAFFGRADTVAALIEAGADLEARSANYMSNTPLCAAIAGRTDPATISALLQAGADASAEAATGVRPLHLAASRGATGVVNELLRRGARADIATDDGKTAAQFAADHGHPEVASLLEKMARGGASHAR